jgi:hypothetical protein
LLAVRASHRLQILFALVILRRILYKFPPRDAMLSPVRFID